MRKAASRLHWQGIGVPVALVLALGILAALLLYSDVRADAPVFNAYAGVEDISDTTTGANADIHRVFGVDKEPWPSLMYNVEVSFQPKEWGVARGEDVPIGARVARLDVVINIGILDNPCNTVLYPYFYLQNCTLKQGDTVTYDQQFQDVNGNGLPDGCDKWPDFLDELFPGMTPRARMFGITAYSGSTMSMNFLIFEPGTDLPPWTDTPPFDPDKGYVTISVLDDPTAPLVIDRLTDMCLPLAAGNYYYGLTRDNPRTGEDESGYPWRTNPCTPDTYTFYDYVNSIRDADADNFDNSLDTCPYDYDPTCDPTDPAHPGDDDGDGLCNVCDPTPNMAQRDPDGDYYKNFQDNCPLVANGHNPSTGQLIGPNDQLDTDLDRIGDECDHYVNAPDGQRAEQWFETPIEITGEGMACPTPTPLPPGVGGVVEMQVGGSGSAADLPAGSSGGSAANRIVLVGLAAAVLFTIAAGVRHARRRFSRG